MADLRALVEDLGYDDVRTLLNSGNVVFAAPDTDTATSAARIQEELAARLGLSAKVIVLTSAELATIVNDNPLLEVADDPSRLLIAIFENPTDGTLLEPLQQQEWNPEVLAIGTRVAYLWCPEGILASRLVKSLGQVLGDAATTRNWATISKLYALSSDGIKK